MNNMTAYPEAVLRYVHSDKAKAKVRARQGAIRAWLRGLKTTCLDCGSTADLHFHHRDPATKVATVMMMPGHYGRAKIQAEVEKCDVLCQPCHMARHHPRVAS